jgi:hypothetical protein
MIPLRIWKADSEDSMREWVIPDEEDRWYPPTNERVPIKIHPQAQDRLSHLLWHDPRFQAIGYSQFIMMALDLFEEK